MNSWSWISNYRLQWYKIRDSKQNVKQIHFLHIFPFPAIPYKKITLVQGVHIYVLDYIAYMYICSKRFSEPVFVEHPRDMNK